MLVHCVAGVSRSAALVLAYLVKYQCKSLRDAYHLLASKRQLVRPNMGFWRQLIHYEQSIKRGRASIRLVQGNRDPDDDPFIIPDVYLPEIVPDRRGEVCFNFHLPDLNFIQVLEVYFATYLYSF